jgi:tetratricopeptide (TPR) repeat protein
MPTQLSRLSMLYSRGLYAEAERLADEIIALDPRQSLPYAVKGDLARGRGKLDEAARQYSLAIQMDPRNATYLRRYEEVLQRVRTSDDPRGATRIEPNERIVLVSLALGVIAILAALFVAVSPERPVLQGFGPVASWTIGLVSMLFVVGVATGACLSIGNALDRLDSYASGHVAPTVALGIVSLVSFPAAALFYLALGVAQRGFNASTTRLMVGVALGVATLSIGAGLSGAHIDPLSVLLWGGNLAYLGALCGWAVTDGLKGG